MVKTIFVTYLIALSVYLTCAYQKECAVGPQYWCKSFQNAQDCGALTHCTDTIWIHDAKYQNIDSTTKCDWCEKMMENTQRAVENIRDNPDLVQSTLINGCKMLPVTDVSNKCIDTIEKYQTTVLTLLTNHRFDRLCQLMNICTNENTDDDSKMLCNVLVRATQELHEKRQKSRDEIQDFLKNDCRTLKSTQLAAKCEDLVDRHGIQIYAHVASHIESSKICAYLDSSALQVKPKVHCELCTFVLSLVKQMLDSQTTEDEILRYIDEQICVRLSNDKQKQCRKMVDDNGRDLLNNIQQGTEPSLLCTHFQLCVNDVLETTSPVEKNELLSFLTNDFCRKLGKYQTICEAAIEKDTTQVLQILANEINGKDLCHLFGLCPKQSLIVNSMDPHDDPTACKRCVKDFTRRKHIAEKLVNHSSQFLHHLCEQLPEKDQCIQSVEQSINELITFIQSLDPRGICVQLNMCDEKNLERLSSNEILPSENVLAEEILEFIKTDICQKHGSLSSFCARLTDFEGLGLLTALSKNLDPHRVCQIVGICPQSFVSQNCQDQSQCCENQIEIYQTKLEEFLKAMVASTRTMCAHVIGREMCFHLADIFESNVETVVRNFNAKRTCSLLNLDSTAQQEKPANDQCETCQSELNLRQTYFRSIVNELTNTLLPLCEDEQCRLNVRNLYHETSLKLDRSDSINVCQRLGYCLVEHSSEPSETTLHLKQLLQHQTKTLEERLQAHGICSEFGQLENICEQILSSKDYKQLYAFYMSVLKNNPQTIDEYLHEQIKEIQSNVDTCDQCKTTIESAKDFWLNTVESARNFFLDTCNYCPDKTQCQDYINHRINDIKTYATNIDAEEFCQNLHLCSTNEFELTTDTNTTCILCEYAMNILSNYIHQKSTEQEIKQGLVKVCNQMPRTLQQQCHDFVENYGPPIIAILIQQFDVSTVCRKLNLCTKQMTVDLNEHPQTDSKACGVCDYVSTYVDFALKRDSSDKSLEHALATVCTQLSSEHQSQCQSIVQLVRVNRKLLQFSSENSFCKQLTICPTPMSELKPAMPLRQQTTTTTTNKQDEKDILMKNLDETPQCMLCRYVVSYLNTVLKNNKSEEAVQSALAKVCTILPKKERASCDNFIKTYGPVIAELLLEMAEPQLVCRYLGMCQAVAAKETTPITYPSHQYARIPV